MNSRGDEHTGSLLATLGLTVVKKLLVAIEKGSDIEMLMHHALGPGSPAGSVRHAPVSFISSSSALVSSIPLPLAHA